MKTVKVWDIFVRMFHWLLVLSVITQLLSAESAQHIHVPIGLLIAFLLLLRIIWGFIGTKHARFSDFIYSPVEISEYLKGLLHKQPKSYLGHNPAGGAMVIALLVCLCLTGLAGIETAGAQGNRLLSSKTAHVVQKAYADQTVTSSNQVHDLTNNEPGPASRSGNSRTGKVWKEIHESMAGIIIFLVVVHICGVFVSSYVHKENLILAMITGKKKIIIDRLE